MFPLKNSNLGLGEASFYLREGQDLDAHWQGQSVQRIPAEEVDRVMRSGDDVELANIADSLAAAVPQAKGYVDRASLMGWLMTWRLNNYRR